MHKYFRQTCYSNSSNQTKQSEYQKKKMMQKNKNNTRKKIGHFRRSNQTLSIHKLADMRHSSYTSRHSTQIIT